MNILQGPRRPEDQGRRAGDEQRERGRHRARPGAELGYAHCLDRADDDLRRQVRRQWRLDHDEFVELLLDHDDDLDGRRRDPDRRGAGHRTSGASSFGAREGRGDLFGGRSSEHDVSLRSGASVAAGLREAGHEVTEVLISRDGRWTAGRRGDRAAGRPAGCSASTSSSPSCTARSARTAASRGCSRCSTSPTRVPACSRPPVALDKLIFKRLLAFHGIPRSISARSERRAGASTRRRWADPCG